MRDAAMAHYLYLTNKADVEKLAQTNSDIYVLIKDSKFQNFDKLDRVQDKITIGRSNQEAIKAIKAQSNLNEKLNESLTFPLWNKIK
jgi:phage shock protein A